MTAVLTYGVYLHVEKKMVRDLIDTEAKRLVPRVSRFGDEWTSALERDMAPSMYVWGESPTVRAASLPDELRSIVEGELARREFMPVITRIVSVASFATPSTWQVETDRGAASLILKGEEDIRRLTPPALLIADSHGIHFLIRDRYALDQPSQRILDRFL